MPQKKYFGTNHLAWQLISSFPVVAPVIVHDVPVHTEPVLVPSVMPGERPLRPV